MGWVVRFCVRSCDTTDSYTNAIYTLSDSYAGQKLKHSFFSSQMIFLSISSPTPSFRLFPPSHNISTCFHVFRRKMDSKCSNNDRAVLYYYWYIHFTLAKTDLVHWSVCSIEFRYNQQVLKSKKPLFLKICSFEITVSNNISCSRMFQSVLRILRVSFSSPLPR